MARRRELQDVAKGTLGKFVGRNNDHKGYWAMGQLYAEASRRKSKGFDFDLVLGEVIPPANAARAVAARFRDYLAAALRKRGLDPVVKSAKLRVEFNALPPAELPPRWIDGDVFIYGDLFAAEFEIVDDRGRRYTARQSGWCAPHDEQRERQRAPAHRSKLL